MQEYAAVQRSRLLGLDGRLFGCSVPDLIEQLLRSFVPISSCALPPSGATPTWDRAGIGSRTMHASFPHQLTVTQSKRSVHKTNRFIRPCRSRPRLHRCANL